MYCENVGFEEHYISYAEYKEYIRKKNVLFVLTKVLNNNNLFFDFLLFF